jgi:hypothetical protein
VTALDPSKRIPALAPLHRLEHQREMCPCHNPPEEPEVEPWPDFYLRMGQRELARMRDAGLPVDLDQVEDVDLIALGESVHPARLAEVLDRVVAERVKAYPSTGCSGCEIGARHGPAPGRRPSFTLKPPKILIHLRSKPGLGRGTPLACRAAPGEGLSGKRRKRLLRRFWLTRTTSTGSRHERRPGAATAGPPGADAVAAGLPGL